eukprot:8735-Pelagococcus_subviridis.AAC.1
MKSPADNIPTNSCARSSHSGAAMIPCSWHAWNAWRTGSFVSNTTTLLLSGMSSYAVCRCRNSNTRALEVSWSPSETPAMPLIPIALGANEDAGPGCLMTPSLFRLICSPPMELPIQSMPPPAPPSRGCGMGIPCPGLGSFAAPGFFTNSQLFTFPRGS